MKWKIIFLRLLVGILFCFLCAGCSFTSSSFLRYEENKEESVLVAIQATKKMLDNWGFRSGLRKRALEGLETRFPLSVTRAMNDLDALYLKHKSSDLTDAELGEALACRLLMISAEVRMLFKRHAPTVLQYLPIGF